MFFLSGCALLTREELLHLIAQFDVLTVASLTQRQAKLASQRVVGFGAKLAELLQNKWGNDSTAQTLGRVHAWSNEVQSWETQFTQTEQKYLSATEAELRHILLHKSADRMGIPLLPKFCKEMA